MDAQMTGTILERQIIIPSPTTSILRYLRDEVTIEWYEEYLVLHGKTTLSDVPALIVSIPFKGS